MQGRGLLALVAAFAIWGFLPLYLQPLHAVPPAQIMAHRLLWCCLFVLGWLASRGELGAVHAALRDARIRRVLTATAALISVNWLVYVWAVGNGQVVEASLGYFINPLVNVALGVAFLGERLRRAQWAAVALAGVGVAYLTWLAGAPPWIALVLAASFGSYGLLRKKVSVEALVGLGTETLLIAPLGAAYLVLAETTGRGIVAHASWTILVLLFLGGLVTAIPLGLFAFGVRRVPYATVGILQYLGPTLQLLLGVAVFHEPFEPRRALGFALIWAALALYAAEGVVVGRMVKR